MKVFNSVVMKDDLKGYSIHLTTSDQEVSPEERRKKTGTEGSIWSQYEKNMYHVGEWINDRKVIRAGVGIVPIWETLYNRQTILNQFDNGHPTMPGKWTPPTGIWDSQLPLIQAALKELGEEVIVITKRNKVGYWLFDGEILAKDWVNRYAQENNLETSDFLVRVEQSQFDIGYEIFLDEKSQGFAMVVPEFDSGSIELLFPVLIKTDKKFTIKDGENFNDKWLHRNCGFFDANQLKLIGNNLKTTKVDAVETLMRYL